MLAQIERANQCFRQEALRLFFSKQDRIKLLLLEKTPFTTVNVPFARIGGCGNRHATESAELLFAMH